MAVLMESKTTFIDSSAFIALYFSDELFHQEAISFWEKARENSSVLLTNNFIFDETLTWICQKFGKKKAVDFGSYLLKNEEIVPVKPILPEDEKKAWELFQKLPGKSSFTDCTCFAMMKRLKIKRVFTFDRHFTKAGFKVVP